MAKSTDNALQLALAQFNDGLKAQQAEERVQRAIDKADREKQQAAAELKRVQANPDASAEEKATADATYREAVDAWSKMKSGETHADTETEPEITADETIDPQQSAENDGGEAAEEEAESVEDTCDSEPSPRIVEYAPNVAADSEA